MYNEDCLHVGLFTELLTISRDSFGFDTYSTYCKVQFELLVLQ